MFWDACDLGKVYMKYLIFSDTHGSPRGMLSVIDRCIHDTDGVIFLGDVCLDTGAVSEKYPDLPIYSVAGNCDLRGKLLAPEESERLIEVDGIRILMLHGHTRSVKYYMGELEAFARRAGADVVLFGHTHERYLDYRNDEEKGLYIFNPGSASQSRDGLPPSFGVLTVMNGQVLLSHGDV